MNRHTLSDLSSILPTLLHIQVFLLLIELQYSLYKDLRALNQLPDFFEGSSSLGPLILTGQD